MKSLLFLSLLVLAPVQLSAQAHLIIVSGLGGEPRYVEDFHRWGLAMVDAAVERFGVPEENVVYLAEDPSRDPARIDGESRREAVVAAIRKAAGESGPDDRVMILLIGHGSADSRGSRINLPGPDLTAEEIKEELAAFPTQPIAIVNTASASGDFIEILGGENRAVITATRSAMERNETVFGNYFVTAYAEDGADANQDGRITLDEAFAFAERETEREYTNTGRLQLEHSRLEGTEEFVRAFHLGVPTTAIPEGASAELTALYQERIRLEGEIDALRVRASQLEPADYQSQLEGLLLELARTNRSIQEMEDDG